MIEVADDRNICMQFSNAYMYRRIHSSSECGIVSAKYLSSSRALNKRRCLVNIENHR